MVHVKFLKEKYNYNYNYNYLPYTRSAVPD